MAFSIVNCAQGNPRAQEVKTKAAQAVVILQEKVKKGYDVSSILPKLTRVKMLGKAGRLDDANALLDEILEDFSELEDKTRRINELALFADDRVVNIEGYHGDAMEVFISRDGYTMFFNSMKTKRGSKDIHFAKRVDDYNFRYIGEVAPINTKEVEGVPTMDQFNNFFYVTTHGYAPNNLVTMYQGKYKNGAVTNIKPLKELSLDKLMWLNMDSEISEDGNTLYSTQSYFGKGNHFPTKSYFFYAKKVGDKFVPQANSDHIFKNINSDEIVYGAGISKDELELFYTRLLLDQKKFESLRATRPSKDKAFGKPQVIKTITGFSEAPALSADENLLYYHKKSPVDGKFRIHVLHRRNPAGHH